MKYFLSYVPSRFLVVLNAFIIVPVFAQMLSAGEMGIFQLTIGLLNLVCTCSTDWIAKSVLRFYQRYSGEDRLDDFLSNAVIIFISVYLITAVLFLFSSNFVLYKFAIPKDIFFFTLFLIIPVGIRQVLYQLLRIFDRPFLYTASIVICQISMISLFLLFAGIIPKVMAVMAAMIVAILVIDIYIIFDLKPKFKFKLSVNNDLLKESLVYALPQIATNASIWAVLNIGKYVFQYNKMFEDTAVICAAALLSSSILTPLFSSFNFALFPVIIRKFERKIIIKNFMTNILQLYCALFIPISLLFCLFSKDISEIAFSGKYPSAFIIIAFFAPTLFFHELMKLFNFKYHLKNKTYVEMAIAFFVGLIAINANILLIPKFGLVGSGIALLGSMLLLFGLNILVQLKGMDYVRYGSVIKTGVLSVITSLFSFVFVFLMPIPESFAWASALKIVMYLFMVYVLSFIFSKKILET